MSKRKTAYRTRKHTTRTTITKSQIEKLRSTRIKNATSYAEKKYYSSASFDKTIRSNVRNNRFNKNRQMLNEIKSRLSSSSKTQRIVNQIFGEKTIVRNQKIVKTNTFTSLKQTRRLSKALQQLKTGKFSVLNYVKNQDKYKEVRKYLPKGASVEDILVSLDRSDFYYQNKTTINKYNRSQSKYGKKRASQMKIGKELSKQYDISDSDNDFIDALELI